MIELREIFEVKANDDFTLECEMENGDIYLYDMSFLKKNGGGPMIQPLKKIASSVKCVGYRRFRKFAKRMI